MEASFLPMDKLLDNFHPSIQLIKRQDVLVSEESQSRAFSKILANNTITCRQLQIQIQYTCSILQLV